MIFFKMTGLFDGFVNLMKISIQRRKRNQLLHMCEVKFRFFLNSECQIYKESKRLENQ
jgi:hypothetical protein